MDLLAQSSVTVPAPVVVYHVPAWQLAVAGGGSLFLLVALVALIVAVLAGIRREKPNSEA